MRRPVNAQIAAAAAIALGIGALLALHLPESTAPASTVFGPRWWPTGLGVGLVLGGLVIALRSRSSDEVTTEPATRYGRRSLAATSVLTVAFLVAWRQVDFRIVALCYAVAVLAALGRRGVRALVVLPVALVATVYLLFDSLLGVPL